MSTSNTLLANSLVVRLILSMQVKVAKCYDLHGHMMVRVHQLLRATRSGKTDIMATDAVYSQQPSKAAPTNQSYFQASKQLNQGVSSRGSMHSGASNKHGENLGGTVVRRVAKERHRTQAGKGLGERTLAKNIDPSRLVLAAMIYFEAVTNGRINL